MDLNNIQKKNIYILVLICTSIFCLKLNANEHNSKSIKWEKIRLNKLHNSNEQLNWQVIEESEFKPNKKELRWKQINDIKNGKKDYTKEYKKNHSKNNIEDKLKNNEFKLLQLGKLVPTSKPVLFVL